MDQKLVAGITGVKAKRTVNPDQAVALGAAAYAGILEGEVKEFSIGRTAHWRTSSSGSHNVVQSCTVKLPNVR